MPSVEGRGLLPYIKRTMDTSSRKTALVVLFNHQYDRNIPVIREIYSRRFSGLLQLMPYYRGDAPDVCSVFGNSFQFYNYILQARERIRNLDGDYILIFGDDLLLNPRFDEFSTPSLLGIHGEDTCYLDGFVDVSLPVCYRGTVEAHRFSTAPAGIDADSVNKNVPPYGEARQILKSRNLMQHDELSRVRMFLPKWNPGGGIHANWKVLKGRIWHLLNHWKHRIKKYRYSYPVVFGYSDIVCIPKGKFDDFCRILEVFSAWNMFVELAIPTALQLLPGTRLATLEDTQYKSGNVWFPQDPEHFEAMNAVIDGLVSSSGGDLGKLLASFPEDYLYLHPVKLSKFGARGL